MGDAEPAYILPGSPRWVKDEVRLACVTCAVDFTLFRRRHHCRNCGEIFCAEHAKANNQGVRYCQPCRALGAQAIRCYVPASREPCSSETTDMAAETPAAPKSPAATADPNSGNGSSSTSVDVGVADGKALAVSPAPMEPVNTAANEVEARSAIEAFLTAAGIGTREGYKNTVDDVADKLVDYGVSRDCAGACA